MTDRSTDAAYHVFFDAMPDAVVVVDSETKRIVEVNSSACTLLSVERNTLVGRSCDTLFAPSHADESVRLVLGAVRAPGPVTVSVQRHDGQPRQVEVTAAAVTVESKNAVQLVLCDVTERTRLEKERETIALGLHQAQKLEALGQLAAGVSHDMNDVLSVVLSCAGALREEVKDPVHTADVDQILVAAHRGRDLVHQLLTFARKEPARKDRFDAFEAVREATTLCARLMPPGVTMVVEVPERDSELIGDRSQFVQAVINLCVNARDAMPTGGTLTVTAADDDKRVVLRVQDTGVGMTDEVQRRAFEPFFTTKPRGGGAGLGLSIVYTAVHSHGGDVRLESRPGEGTQVTLWVPHALDDAASMEDEPAPRLGRVLVIDDDENLRRVLGYYLRQLGFEAVLAASGEEGLAKFSLGAVPRLAMCDFSMPGTDGAETTRRLKQLAPSLPVIITSGFMNPQESDRVRQAGAVEVLSKPFSLDEVRRAVGRVLELPSA